jgi:hypothetical protein
MSQIEYLIEKEYHDTVEWAMCIKAPGSDRYEILHDKWPYNVNTKGMEFYMIRVKMIPYMNKDMNIYYTMHIAHPIEVIKMYTLIEPRKKNRKYDTEEI